MIARCFLLLVGRILFFVHDQQCQIANRGEHRGARAHNHSCLSPLDAVPLRGSFLIGECRMQDSHFIAENLVQISSDGRRKANFRNQQDRGSAGVKHSAHAREINCCFARASNAM